MPGRHHLFVPGPSNVPDRVLRAMHRAQEDHRSSAFPELTHGLLRDIKPVFGATAARPVPLCRHRHGHVGSRHHQHPLAGRSRVLAVRLGPVLAPVH
jgi:hypothetical protein